jgi:AraC family transcriptional regulator, regulatory protein of adaptative response / DNA-3-methyladenine glycosylase II
VILPAREPFAGAALIDYLARRAIPGIEQVAGGVYTRAVGDGTVSMRPVRGGVDVSDEGLEPLLDLDADAPAIGAALSADPVLAPLVARSPGLRVPGTTDAAELCFRAVLGQQISLAAAATHAGRIVAAAGRRLARPAGAVTHAWPSPAAIAALPDEVLAMPASRRRTIRALAAHLEGAGSVEPAALLALPGIGPWTATYVAMRAGRDADAFLATDLGVKHALKRLPGADPSLWRPYRAYAVMYLWASLSDQFRPAAAS